MPKQRKFTVAAGTVTIRHRPGKEPHVLLVFNLGYVLLGSTVERLLREIPCSALVVRPPVGDGSKPERKGDDTAPGRSATG